MNKICPKCNKNKSDYHLMMGECDECINEASKNLNPHDKYVRHALGILVLNPEWVKFQELQVK